jgi:hypothetical protein
MLYIAITAPQHKNRHYVARSAAGGGSYVILATCNSEETARRIASAMNLQDRLPEKVELTEHKMIRQRYKQGSADTTGKSKAA